MRVQPWRALFVSRHLTSCGRRHRFSVTLACARCRTIEEISHCYFLFLQSQRRRRPTLIWYVLVSHVAQFQPRADDCSHPTTQSNNYLRSHMLERLIWEFEMWLEFSSAVKSIFSPHRELLLEGSSLWLYRSWTNGMEPQRVILCFILHYSPATGTQTLTLHIYPTASLSNVMSYFSFCVLHENPPDAGKSHRRCLFFLMHQ